MRCRPPDKGQRTEVIGHSTTAGGTVEVFINGASAGTTSVAANGTWSRSVAPLQEGSVVKARQTMAGATSAFSSDTIVVGPPPAPTLHLPLVATATHVSGAGVATGVVTVVIDPAVDTIMLIRSLLNRASRSPFR